MYNFFHDIFLWLGTYLRCDYSRGVNRYSLPNEPLKLLLLKQLILLPFCFIFSLFLQCFLALESLNRCVVLRENFIFVSLEIEGIANFAPIDKQSTNDPQS